MIHMGPTVSTLDVEKGGVTERGWDIEALEGGNAGSLSLHDVVCCRETKVVSGEGESDIWKRGNFITINGIGAIPRLLRSDFLVQQLPINTRTRQ